MSDERRVRLIKSPIKDIRTGEIIHAVGDVITIYRSKSWCGTYPWYHKCERCGDLHPSWNIGQLGEYLEAVD